MEKQVAFDTSLLDAAIAQRQADQERKRREVLDHTLCILDEIGPEHGIREAYVFGSVTSDRRFTERSDVDIAVEQIAPAHLFEAMGALSMALQRDVDLIELRKCHFADRIREEGIRWTKRR